MIGVLLRLHPRHRPLLLPQTTAREGARITVDVREQLGRGSEGKTSVGRQRNADAAKCVSIGGIDRSTDGARGTLDRRNRCHSIRTHTLGNRLSTQDLTPIRIRCRKCKRIGARAVARLSRGTDRTPLTRATVRLVAVLRSSSREMLASQNPDSNESDGECQEDPSSEVESLHLLLSAIIASCMFQIPFRP